MLSAVTTYTEPGPFLAMTVRLELHSLSAAVISSFSSASGPNSSMPDPVKRSVIEIISS